MRIAIAIFSALLLSSVAFADIDFSDYHNPAQVAEAMTDLQSAYPAIAKIVNVGTSTNGEPINALKISDNVGTDETNEGDVIFIAAHHAREWLSVEMALYLAEYLLQHYATDAQLRADINNLEIWIVPISNPDGVAYSWDPAGDRYWRKNRRDNGDGTRGVDLNRNWGYAWGLESGSSPNTSDDNYRGPYAFSERETQDIRDLVNNVNNLKAFVSYHTYSELFLRPWAFTDNDPPGESTLKSIADRSIARIAAVHGHTYTDGIWYTASGDTTDYLWGETRTAAFTPEMRPHCGLPPTCGLAGFSPPATEIIPNNEENLPAALALIHDAGAREIWIRDYPADSGAEPSAVWTAIGWTHAFWESPDIWTVPETLNQGATVELNVRVHNNTGVTKNNVQLDVYWTDPRISLEFPNPDATLIGSQTVNVPPEGITVTMPWKTPVGTNILGERHWCVGAIVKHADDMPLTTQAQRTSNMGIRNFNTTEVVEGGTLMVAATNFLQVASELVVTVDKEHIPKDWHVTLPPRPAPVPGIRPTAPQRKAKLLGAKGILLEPGETIVLPLRVDAPPDVKPGTQVDVHVHAALLPLVAGKREAVGNGYTYRVIAAEPCDKKCKKRQ
ncbi:MAG: zinc carboxypeptidase [Pseudomonadota bacterium]|nr:MAG: zinc carboxypeptidase [Pseudomonadota bacterium]